MQKAVPFAGQQRADHLLIAEMVTPGSRVLDVGCGDGALLKLLAETKGVDGRGVELSREKVNLCVKSGLSVIQGDADRDLADYPDQAFDFAILSLTIQATREPKTVLENLLRIGRHAIVSFPNFGHWRVRLAHLTSGRAPRTPLFPHNWYESPNIHFLTVLDFEEFIREQGWVTERRLFLAGHRQIARLPNLLAEIAVYLIRRP